MSRARLHPVQELRNVLEHRHLSVQFQPVIDLSKGNVIGYEQYMHGPPDSLLYSPLMLRRVARRHDLLLELENMRYRLAVDEFLSLKLPGALFFALSADLFLAHKLKDIPVAEIAEAAGFDPQRIVITLTGQDDAESATANYLKKIIAHYAKRGIRVALDDEGESLLLMKSEADIQPYCVKLSPHLIQNIDRDPVRVKLVKSLLAVAENAGVLTLAQGIETRSEMLLASDLGIALGQGTFIAAPSKQPLRTVSREVRNSFASNYKQLDTEELSGIVAILQQTPSFSLERNNEEVFQFFERDADATSVAVVNKKVPVGLINRNGFINRYARPFQRELYGKKPCTTFMDPDPLIVDRNISIQDLSCLLARDQRHVSLGFIFTENGAYFGVGSSQHLIQEITKMQIQSARYANPLTGLPGNAPIDEHIDALLAGEDDFCICYFDLDNFKPFNDVYGFSMGDAMIQMTARILFEGSDQELDFVGHIGGDDFIVLFCSQNWEARCQAMLHRFEEEVQSFFNLQDLDRGGYVAENRRGEKEFHRISTLSIGAVQVHPGEFKSHREVATVAAESKKMAKKMEGNSLFINQRNYADQSAQNLQAKAS